MDVDCEDRAGLMIKELLVDKTHKEQAQIKSEEIAKLNISGEYVYKEFRIEILSLEKIEVNGQSAIEVMARAWKNDEQLGFGSDGTVDIERFRIFNPIAEVRDGTFDVVDYTDSLTGEAMQKKVYHNVEDPTKAIQEDLGETIRIMNEKMPEIGKVSNKIISGKVGHTVSTFNPVAGTNSPIDGWVQNSKAATWADTQDDATGTDASATVSNTDGSRVVYADASTRQLGRFIFHFDTSALTVNAIISAAVFSVYGSDYSESSGTGLGYLRLVTNTLDADNAITTGDYDATQFGTAALANDILQASIVTGAFNDFTLLTPDSTVSKTGLTRFGIRSQLDIDVSAPANPTRHNISFVHADAGSNIPKLVVTHSLPANSAFLLFMGPQPQQ